MAMAWRGDLTYEKRETETPYIFSDASDIDEALRIARCAILDAESFRDYAKATGVDVVKEKVVNKRIIGWSAVTSFIFGAIACFLFLWVIRVI